MWIEEIIASFFDAAMTNGFPRSTQWSKTWKKPNPHINYDLQVAEHCCHIWKELTNLAMVTIVFSGSKGCLPPVRACHCGHRN